MGIKMRVVKLKKKCMIRGCASTESFAISKSASEIGNIFLCASCLAEALSGIDEARKVHDEARAKKKAYVSSPLFYHPELECEQEAENKAEEEVLETEGEIMPESDENLAGEEETTSDEIVEEKEENEGEADGQYICPICAKVYASEKSLKAHMKKAHKE